MTLREALAAASAEAASFGLHDHSQPATEARRRRNELMRYACDRGVQIRELCAVTGLTSTSTVQYILVRAKSGGRNAAALDDAAPVDLQVAA